MKNKKQAFTLAEVLLVLAIIGVISAVTIPAIMQQSSEKKFAALAKKAQSTLQNAIDKKIAMVPLGPGDLKTGLFQWLADGEDDGTNTIKIASSNNETYQTPDGMIFYVTTGNICTAPSTNTDKLGCRYSVYVDLNGAEPPTRTSINDLSALKATDNGTAYDIIYIAVRPSGNVEPGWSGVSGGYSIDKRRNRAKKYLSL